MLGLSIDKLLIVAIVAACIIGPARLPGYAKRLGETVRGLRAFLDDARTRVEAETGLSSEDWTSLDPRQYDPRRIVREALSEPAGPDAEPLTSARPATVAGSSAHPRRVLAPRSAGHSAAAGAAAASAPSAPAAAAAPGAAAPGAAAPGAAAPAAATPGAAAATPAAAPSVTPSAAGPPPDRTRDSTPAQRR
ncbi:Sec-independent protein translocase subunit TatA/TatB [Arenivirga flava]|uniref:Sec-independent protein translocase TatB n=1 Tax=Arenivirga flava TaxID=1930060 RepID=A0AA37XBG2_9MICO|nr:twin-arginine translocase TatA/TatE family subunit [Arenivirga flava]GMA28621.1 hypothetical protein GCM10025874_18740 [Arenivirga flava]